MDGGPLQFVWHSLRAIGEWLWDDHKNDLVYAAFVAAWGVMRLAGKTVESGSLGLKFSFGLAARVCEPGFYPLIPFFQTIRVLPSRSRTLMLPPQRLTTEDGLVYQVDATLVYRVVDVRKALVEVDDLEQAMSQILSLGVHSVLSRLERSELSVSRELDQRLAAAMATRLEAWGVSVERAGFDAIAPTGETALVTQLAQRVNARAQALELLRSSALSRARALSLLGSSTRFTTRMRRARHDETQRRLARRMQIFRTRLAAELDVPTTAKAWSEHRAELRLREKSPSR